LKIRRALKQFLLLAADPQFQALLPWGGLPLAAVNRTAHSFTVRQVAVQNQVLLGHALEGLAK
jgi:hypothetical protein